VEKNLLEAILERRAESETDQPPQGHIPRGAGEPFHVGRLDRSLANLFDVHRMSQRCETVPVVNLEHLRHALSHSYEQNAFRSAKRKDRCAAF